MKRIISFFVAAALTVAFSACKQGKGDNGDKPATESATQSVIVSTLAGSTLGAADGTGAEVQFFSPSGIAVDASGNLYVTDYWNHRVRKVTPAGEVTSLAGSVLGFADGPSIMFGHADGTGTAARFWNPVGITADASGNLYIADFWNHRIRKMTPEGVVTTLAGSGDEACSDGRGTAAKFRNPHGIVADALGNLYVTDSGNHRIRKITPSGVVTTLAGSAGGYIDGTGSTAKFCNPYGIAIDAAGNLYVADRSNNRIRKVTPAGEVTTLASSGDYGYADGAGTEAKFAWPAGIAADASGNLYVADTFNNRIRKVTLAGEVTTLAGSGDYDYADGSGSRAKFSYPYGIAIDATGNLYVADSNNNCIRKIVL